MSTTQNGVVVRADVTRIAGTYWNFTGYWRGRLNSSFGEAAQTQTLHDLLNRTYHIGLYYNNPAIQIHHWRRPGVPAVGAQLEHHRRRLPGPPHGKVRHPGRIRRIHAGSDRVGLQARTPDGRRIYGRGRRQLRQCAIQRHGRNRADAPALASRTGVRVL